MLRATRSYDDEFCFMLLSRARHDKPSLWPSALSCYSSAAAKQLSWMTRFTLIGREARILSMYPNVSLFGCFCVLAFSVWREFLDESDVCVRCSWFFRKLSSLLLSVDDGIVMCLVWCCANERSVHASWITCRLTKVPKKKKEKNQKL